MRDQSLRNKMNSYHSEYPANAWSNVKVRLEQKKKRRLLIFFLLFFTLLCGIMGIYKMVTSRPEVSTPKEIPTNIIS